MKIIYYGQDKQPVKEFIDKLPLKDRAKIFACLKSLEDLGLDTPRVVCRQIIGKLWEIKISASIGYRIFYITIEIAKNRMAEVLKDETIYIR